MTDNDSDECISNDNSGQTEDNTEEDTKLHENDCENEDANDTDKDEENIIGFIQLREDLLEQETDAILKQSFVTPKIIKGINNHNSSSLSQHTSITSLSSNLAINVQ